MESLVVAAFAVLGLRLGSVPIDDNSALVHIRTGIDMIAGAGIPRNDPYSFTAAGEPWVVQSWLASGLYGLAERAGGLSWVVALNALLMGGLAALIVRLARTGRPLRTAAAGVVVLAVGVGYWAPRPLLIGLIGLALTVTVVTEKRRGVWLLPVVWIWANSHGSFPLGGAFLALVATGAAIDGRHTRAALPALRYLAWFLGGLALAAVNPLGPRLLAFSATVGEKQAVFARIVEWSSPDFHTAAGMVALAGLAALLLTVGRARPLWADLLPVAAFAAAGLIASRNLPMLGVVAAPLVGRAWAAATPWRAPAGSEVIHLAFAVVLAATGLAFVQAGVSGPGLDTGRYPDASIAWLAENGRFDEPHRTAEDMFAGGLVVFREGRNRSAFIDDRVDMYPVAVTRAYLALLDGTPRALDELRRHRIDTVLWRSDRPLATILGADPEWRLVRRDGDYSLFVLEAG